MTCSKHPHYEPVTSPNSHLVSSVPVQYIEESDVGYIVSGAGNFLDPDVRHWNKVPEGSIRFFTGKASTLGGFIHAEVTKNKMIVTFFQAKGTSLYRTILSQRDVD